MYYCWSGCSVYSKSNPIHQSQNKNQSLKIKLQKHASIFIKLHNWNLMVHRANQRLYWMIHLTFGHYYWMILQKNLGMTPPYHSGRGRYTQGFNDFRKGTLNQFFSSLCVSCVHYHNRNHNPNHNNHNQKKKLRK